MIIFRGTIVLVQHLVPSFSLGDFSVQRLREGPSNQWRTHEFCSGSSTNSVEDRKNGDLGGGNPLVRGSGGSCNVVQEISFYIVKVS